MVARGTRGPRRRMRWIEITRAQHTPGAGSQSTQDLLFSFTGGVPTELRGHTLARIILQVSMYAEIAEATGDAIRLDYGVAMVSDEASVGAAFPDPAGPDAIPWILRDHRIVVDSGATLEQRDVTYVMYDVAVGRKFLDDSTHLRLVIDNSTVIGGGLASFHTGGRVLLWMP